MRRSGSRAGVTLVEIMISITVVIISIIGLLFVIAHATKQNQANRETLAAHRAAMAVIERMSSKPIENVFKMYNGSDGDMTEPMGYADASQKGLDLYLNMVEPGPWFDVETVPGPGGKREPALRLPTGSTRERCGLVQFPVNTANPAESGAQLWENPQDPNGEWSRWFQMPRDLNGTGVVENGDDVSLSYKILPVIVSVQWEGVTGVRTLTYKHILFGR